MVQATGLKLALVTCLIAMLSSCGGDDYTKNSDQNKNNGAQDQSGNADATKNNPGGESSSGNEQGNPELDAEAADPSDDNKNSQGGTPGSGVSGITWQDLISGILGGGKGGGNSNSGNSSGGNSGSSAGQAGNTTPIPPAPEPSSDDCIGADEFICAIEVAITYHTNLLRPANRPLMHHARLSYVARDWSQKQMQSGSIGHQGFPNARRQVYGAAFPGDSVSIQAENVAYSSGRSGEAEAIAKMFVNMWANSSGHRRNMLGGYGIIGVGVTKSGSRYYATQLFGQP